MLPDTKDGTASTAEDTSLNPNAMLNSVRAILRKYIEDNRHNIHTSWVIDAITLDFLIYQMRLPGGLNIHHLKMTVKMIYSKKCPNQDNAVDTQLNRMSYLKKLMEYINRIKTANYLTAPPIIIEMMQFFNQQIVSRPRIWLSSLTLGWSDTILSDSTLHQSISALLAEWQLKNTPPKPAAAPKPG